MYYQLSSYLNFLLHSTNQHGVHSPFVYGLVTQCFYDKRHHPAYPIIKAHRKKLVADTSTLSITDFGAGSRVFKSNERTVRAIAKNAGISQKRQRLLYRLAHYLQPKNVLELGTSMGLGTMALALADSSKTVITVEGCAATSAKAQQYFDAFEIENIQIETSIFDTFFQHTPSKHFDMVYIDGNHSKKATLHYFDALLKFATNDAVFIFDDIYWSLEMTEAWNSIRQHPEVTVSIDTFQWGLVFFRKEQPKQHFKIRV